MSPCSAAGGLLPEIAGRTGMRPGIPVSPAVHDQYASALATGATNSGTVMVGTGTAWVLLHVTDKVPKPVTDEAFICHHVIDGLWGQILSMVNGGSAVTWALEMTGHAGKDGKGIDQLLASAAPGSEGVTFWPFMTPFGASAVVPGNRGRFDGLQLHHKPAHLLRAVVEGLGYELKRYLNLLRDAGQEVQRLVMGGGAASSSVTPSLLADITGLPLRCFAGSDASLLGAAILARGLLEPQRSPGALADEMASVSREILPGDNDSFYQEQYASYLRSLPLRSVPSNKAHNLQLAQFPPIPLYFVWNYTNVDREFWQEHLESWLPRRIFDAHTHVALASHRLVPMTDAMRKQYWVNELFEPIDAQTAANCYRTVFPGRDLACLAFGMPDLDFDLDAGNAYLQAECVKRGWLTLAVIQPNWPQQKIAALLNAPGVIGVKPYYSLISPDRQTRDAHLEASIFDFLPHHVLEVLNERQAWVTLHVPKAARLGHPDNVREVREIRRRYPDISLVIAHLGRCYTEPHALEALPQFADDPGLFFDTSAVLNPVCHRIALEHFGPDRIIYGSDNPILYMRGRRQYQDRTYINRTSHPFFFNKKREVPETEAKYTLFMYEDLRAIKQACDDLGITERKAIEAIFYDNAWRLARKCLQRKN